MAYSWFAVEARTGNVLAELPGLDVQSIGATLGDYSSTQATLPVPTAPSVWERATEPYGSMLVLVDDTSGGNGTPVWGALVIDRTRTEADTVSLDLATPEAYFDRRYVGDKTYTQVDQAAIVADLIATYVADGTNGGLPITVQNVTPSSTTLRDRTYADEDDKTVYSALQELMGVIGGPEWTVKWTSSIDSGQWTITPVLEVGTRIGRAPNSGLQPYAAFEMADNGGNLVAFQYKEDWTTGNGANDVMAVSTANADTRPQSAHQVFTDTDRPTVEYRFTPSSSITSVSTLNSHAKAMLSALEAGTQTLALTAVVDAAPRLGIDWDIGDDIYFNIETPVLPSGLSGIARCVGWVLNFDDVKTVKPVVSFSEILSAA